MGKEEQDIYEIKRSVSDNDLTKKITKKDFEEIKITTKYLSSAREIEEKYEIILHLYKKLEQDAINISLDATSSNIKFDKKWFIMFNVHILSLLSAVRMYLDHIRQDLKHFKCEEEKFNSFRNNEYDKSLEYKIMEELRNYTQHNGLVVHSVSLSTEWYRKSRVNERRQVGYSETKNNKSIRYIEVFCKKNELNIRKIKKRVLDEMPEKIELLSTIRVYLSCISNIHFKVRDLIKKDCKKSRELIENIIFDYKKTSDSGKDLGLYAYHYCNNKVFDTIPILLDWDDFRLALTQKNSLALTNLKNRGYSNILIEKDDF